MRTLILYQCEKCGFKSEDSSEVFPCEPCSLFSYPYRVCYNNMKTVVLYQCEICGSKSEDYEKIKVCEGRSFAPDYPTGLIYQYRNYREIDDPKFSEEYYNLCTFAVARSRPDGHKRCVISWAVRHNGYGNSLEPWERVKTHNIINGGLPTLLDKNNVPNKDKEHYKEMVAFIRSQGLTPFVWTGNGWEEEDTSMV